MVSGSQFEKCYSGIGMLHLFGGKIKIYFSIDSKKVEKSPIVWKAERKIGLLKGLFKTHF